MGKNPNSQWHTQRLSRRYLDGVRGAIPLADSQIAVMLKIIHAWCPNLKRFMDLGCGDGVLGRAVLASFPDVQGMFVDFSDPMIAAVHQKVQTCDTLKIIQSDFSTPDWLKSIEDWKAFDLIISGFSIHHQQDERKRELYTEIYSLLAPGGVFLNLEHVASATKAIEAIFDDYFIDHLFAFHSQSDQSPSRQKIAETYYARSDRNENILAPVEEQCKWLRQIGFKDVDCFFKVFELALFGGRKSN